MEIDQNREEEEGNISKMMIGNHLGFLQTFRMRGLISSSERKRNFLLIGIGNLLPNEYTSLVKLRCNDKMSHRKTFMHIDLYLNDN